jgi:hypothetical protein
MKASELRCGNWVCIHSIELQMCIDDFNFREDFFKPIPLTEEWLLKFGFKKLSHNHIWQKITKANRVFNVEEADGYIKKAVGFGVSEDGYRMVQIYVHQIQNLYFALTGEELTTHNE